MKIVHLCLGCFYPDNYSYQENMLPKFHLQIGYEVEVIASLATFDENGNPTFMDNTGTYINEYGIKVTRLVFKKPEIIYRKLKRYYGTYDALSKSNPDILFVHGCQFMDMDIVVNYVKKHDNVKLYIDNHADSSNSGRNWFSRNILHKHLWRHEARIAEPYAIKFYGVLPARVDWLIDMYKLPKSKCELLVMGADDDKVKEASRPEIRINVRKKLNIFEDDFLIITGGKIDSAKVQTIQLMEAVANIENPKVKLVVFGSVAENLKEVVKEHCIKGKVMYIGWIQSSESYKYFSAADLVVFPGRHSVFWEQVAGMGIPMLCKFWKGTTHVDLGGNVEFLNDSSSLEIRTRISEIVDNPEKYTRMKQIAKEKGMNTFSYKKIAERAINE